VRESSPQRHRAASVVRPDPGAAGAPARSGGGVTTSPSWTWALRRTGARTLADLGLGPSGDRPPVVPASGADALRWPDHPERL